MTEDKIISHCSICDAPILLKNKKAKRTCYHSDQDDVAHRLGLK